MKNFKQIIVTGIFTSCLVFAANSLASSYVDDAKNYFEKGKYNAAIIQLKNHLKESPEDASARYLLAKSYLKEGNVTLADKEISRAYQLDGNSNEITLTYAQILLLNRKFKEVNELLDRKFSVPEMETQRQIYRASAFIGQNQLADAKQILTRLVNQYENIQVYNGLAKIAVLEKENSLAEKWLEKALIIDPDNFNTLQIKRVDKSP